MMRWNEEALRPFDDAQDRRAQGERWDGEPRALGRAEDAADVINQPLIAVIYDVVCGHEAGNYRPAMLCNVLARNPRIVIPTTSFCFSS